VNDFRSHSSSEFYKNKISVRSSQKLLLLLVDSPCLSGALCPSLCCLLLSSRLSLICAKLQWVPLCYLRRISLSLSLPPDISLCLSLSPGRVHDVYVLSPGPALSTHESTIQQLTTAAASRFQLRSVEPSSRATFTLLSKICLVFALKE
jgi:hypothetical protein